MANLAELTAKLKEIFQIDRADLDFGIYRILNTRNSEIEKYLTQTLPAQVREAFSDSQSDDLASLKASLEQARANARELGVEPENSPKVQELQSQVYALENKSASSNLENAVYSHLLTFFSRYYCDGDFLSQRRYNANTYAIPYNGEEVLLHWANKDQYYTKSGENFANYRFSLADGRTVFFKLNHADIAKDNRKDSEKKRLFTLASHQTVEIENAEGEMEIQTIEPISQSSDGKNLTLIFDYLLFDNKAKQAEKNLESIEQIFAHPLVQNHWQALTELMSTEKNSHRTLLEKHLSDYTQKNTADYFIHKDLGGFLRRELDFYIKNEVMNLDELQSAEQFQQLQSNFNLIKTLRKIALDLIAFLAQLEDFQKKLWLKKKFVTHSHYLITLDRILNLADSSNKPSNKPSELVENILQNQAQFKQWQELFGVEPQAVREFLTNPQNCTQSNQSGGVKTPLSQIITPIQLTISTI